MRPSHLAGFALLLAPLLALAAPQPPAGEKPPGIAPPTAQDQADKRMAFMKSALSHFAVRVGDRKEASKAADPCLRFTDPVTGATEGVLAVFAHDRGRPDAIAQFFFNFQKRWVVEFTVVPDADVTVLRSGRELWKPTEFVCKFADLPGAPTPADKPALRLAQMRAIAADFAVADWIGAQEMRVDLRLLTQPAYRYAEPGKITDGAMFVFAHGTNPEACVLLEAYPGGKGPRYRYAVAPMSIYRLEARYKGDPVWSVPYRPAGRHNARSYYADGYTPEPGETPPD